MIKIYTTPSCPYCYTLKKFLEEKGFKFEEVDVANDETAREEIVKKTGKMELPIIEIDGEVVVGFDKEKVCKLLGIRN